MANPTSVGSGDYYPALVSLASAAISFTLDPNKTYGLMYMGEAGLGTAFTGDIFWSVSNAFVTNGASASLTPQKGKFALTTAMKAVTVYVGPALSKLIGRTSAGAGLVQVIPGASDFGGH